MNLLATKKKLHAAVSDLYKNDELILSQKYHMRENTITHRLAVYLEDHFQEDGYVVDIEYNRMQRFYQGVGEDVSILLAEKLKGGAVSNKENLINPDIVVHKRDTNDNLVEIEVRRAWDHDQALYDLRKVNEYMKILRYRYGVYLELTERIEDVKMYSGPFSL